MLTIEQIRAGRALLNWSQADLAEHASLSQTGIARIENGTNKPNSKTLEKIHKAFDTASIEFIGSSGLRKKEDSIRTLRGAAGLQELVDDIYVSAKRIAQQKGSSTHLVSLYNAKPENWHKWLGKDWWNMHSARMAKIGSDVQRIMMVEGDAYRISEDFSEHKSFPAKLFNDQSIYAYDGKLAFVTFGETVTINVLHNPQFCDGFQVLFDIAWQQVAKPL